ncbi:MAG: NTP transferase domain-containing protein [Oscillospiraceae bacterium]|nr:NTP transferase domain-containing protein [Oscillospiraceae bacterium]
MDKKLKAVVLAAGKGTRLQTEGAEMPKVMREALGKPLLSYVLDGLGFIEKEDIIIVVGYKKEKVTAAFEGYTFAVQREQLGTGHAAMSAKKALSGYDGAVLVCCGDMPLIRRDTYEALVRTHFEEGNACTMLTGTTAEKLPYGRVLRDADGGFDRIVEERDCTPAQAEIDELNSGVYVFDAKKLLPALSELKNNNSQGEYYLTDVPYVMQVHGEKIGICKRDLGYEIIGVNTQSQLDQVERLLREEKEEN